MRNVSVILLICVVSIATSAILIQPAKPQSEEEGMVTFSTNHLRFLIELYYDPYNISSGASIRFTISPQAYVQGETPNIYIDFVKFVVTGISAPTTGGQQEYDLTLASNVDLYFNQNITQLVSGFVISNIGNPPPHSIDVGTFEEHYVLPSSEPTNGILDSVLPLTAYDTLLWSQMANKPPPPQQETPLLGSLTYLFIGTTGVLSVALVALWRERRKFLKKL